MKTVTLVQTLHNSGLFDLVYRRELITNKRPYSYLECKEIASNLGFTHYKIDWANKPTTNRKRLEIA